MLNYDFTDLHNQIDLLNQDYFYKSEIKNDITINRIFFIGMGGSAISCEFFKDTYFDKLKRNIEIVRDYNLPRNLNSEDLVIIDSYSGNTEEVLSALEQAKSVNSNIVTISSGGALLKEDLNLVELPSVPQPRFATFAQLKIIVEIFAYFELIEEGSLNELLDTYHSLKIKVNNFSPIISAQNISNLKNMSEKLVGKFVKVICPNSFSGLGYKWKININENAKSVCSLSVIPELNHNDMQGLLNPEDKSNHIILNLKSKYVSERILKRTELTIENYKKHGYEVVNLQLEGDSLIEEYLLGIVYSDFVTVIMALQLGINPIKVDIIEDFKKKLNE